jgi:hypothetical protein
LPPDEGIDQSLLSFPRKRELITIDLWNMGPRLRGDDNRRKLIEQFGMTAG